jgi:hypothetical protein
MIIAVLTFEFLPWPRKCLRGISRRATDGLNRVGEAGRPWRHGVYDWARAIGHVLSRCIDCSTDHLEVPKDGGSNVPGLLVNFLFFVTFF